MAIDLDKFASLKFPVREYSYDERDTILYALGVGFGRDLPGDENYIFEKNLRALPTLATVIAWEDTWQDAVGLDVSKVVHGEMRLTLHRPLASQGRIKSHFRVRELIDKGPGRGAIVFAQTDLVAAEDDSPIATLLSTVFARGDGGFGGATGKGPVPHRLPPRSADLVCSFTTREEQAAIYRLSGDRNPLHIHQEAARAAGFEKPILHGLCTWGVVAGRVIRRLCAGDATRLSHFEARFTAPVFPGETLITEMWMDDDVVSFRTRVADRGVVVLDHGKALLRLLNKIPHA